MEKETEKAIRMIAEDLRNIRILIEKEELYVRGDMGVTNHEG